MKISKFNFVNVKTFINIEMTICLIMLKKLENIEKRKCLTQHELAKILNVSYVSVCRWETGRFEPTMNTKKKLVALFNEISMKLDD